MHDDGRSRNSQTQQSGHHARLTKSERLPVSSDLPLLQTLCLWLAKQNAGARLEQGVKTAKGTGVALREWRAVSRHRLHGLGSDFQQQQRLVEGSREAFGKRVEPKLYYVGPGLHRNCNRQMINADYLPERLQRGLGFLPAFRTDYEQETTETSPARCSRAQGLRL